MIELNPQISAAIEGVIGRGVRSASIVDGDLILAFTDGGTVNVGHVNGEDGVGIASTVLNPDYTLTITLTNGTSYTTASIRGAQGIQGIQGIQGVQGPTGRTAFESAVIGGYSGTEALFNEALAKAFNAEAYAVGERGGTPVPSTDPTYHNNAKYYSAEAETAADEAASSAEEIEDLTVSASSLPAGSTPTVTKTGGSGAPYNLAFGIPKGDTGSPGQDGAPGADGQDGEDGVSPAVTITPTSTGHTVKITDRDHPQGQSFNVSNGQDGQDGAPGADGQDGEDGVSPAVTITPTSTGHTVKITDRDHPQGQSFNVSNGQDGQDGAPGADGQDGQDGSPGADGITPTIGSNGNWYLGDTDTGKPSRGEQGEPGSDAEVTAANIEVALGYVPADEDDIPDLSPYRTSAAQDVIDAGKQDTITDLATIRSGASAGATALQPPPIKTTMDSVAVAGAKYFLGEQTAVSITMSTDALLGQEVSVVFYSGITSNTPTALTFSTPVLGSIPSPTVRQRTELSLLWDGVYWAVISNVMEVPT